VKFPTGGNCLAEARELFLNLFRNGRSGVTPEPTVKVRMGEDSNQSLGAMLRGFYALNSKALFCCAP
jgi:glucose/arabinose dehydrogenase